MNVLGNMKNFMHESQRHLYVSYYNEIKQNHFSRVLSAQMHKNKGFYKRTTTDKAKTK